MVTRASSCDHNRLLLLLDDGLGESDRVAVEEHLSECDSCCETLQTLAGDDTWWSDASVLLSPIDGDDGPTGAKEKPLRLLQSSPLSSVEQFVGDMALDFLDPSDSPAMLGRLGQYDIIEPLGCGGMGIVLKGYDQDLNRYVAIKVLAPHYATSSAARKRFAREGQASAAVVNPHVVAIHGVCSDGRLPYLVMPYVQGESLQQRIDAAGPLKLKETLRISMQAARGLQAAHEQGLVHRDIKPGNILLERGVDRVLLTDFGLARAVDDASMTRSGVIAGTPQYMSPEQARGDSVELRSDLFSLGSVMYAMCAGRPPFRADNTMGLLNRIVEGSPRPVREVNPEVPEWLATIIERLHAKSPDDRLGSAGELADLLERCLAHVQQPQTQPLPESLRIQTTSRWLRRSLVGSLVAGVVVCVALAAGGVFSPDPRDDSAETSNEGTAEEGFAGAELSGEEYERGEFSEREHERLFDGDESLPDWIELDEELHSLAAEVNDLNWEIEEDIDTGFEQSEHEEATGDEAPEREASERETPERESSGEAAEESPRETESTRPAPETTEPELEEGTES